MHKDNRLLMIKRLLAFSKTKGVKMKFLILFAMVLGSVSAWSSPVEGEIFYKKKSGDVARRALTLTVPSRGQGEVVLSGERFEWKTESFWSTVVNGEVIFTAVFKTEFMGMTSTIAFRGTYLKGNNEIVYSGNFYKKDGHGEFDRDLTGFEYNGGFNFSYTRN